MDPIEESVRRALEGGNPSDHAFRQSIYAASLRAMDRMVASRGLAGEAAEEERGRVAEIIARVEGEYAAYYGGADSTPADARPATAPVAGRAAEGQGTTPATPVAASQRPPASFEAPESAPAQRPEGEMWRPGSARPSGSPKSRPTQRRILPALLFLVLLAVFLVGTILYLRSGEDVPATSATGERTGEAASTLPWLDAFTGTDLELLSAPEGGRVSAVQATERPAIRLAGPEGAEAEILVALGPGLVGQLTGSNVRVELVAGSPDGNLREFSVRCLFGGTSICERQRFSTSMPEEAFVFDIEVPQNASSPASLAIGPEPSTAGADVDLYSVRMRVL